MTLPITYISDFIPRGNAAEVFDTLWRELDWEQRENTPRREYWTNDYERSYTYGRNMGVRTYDHRPSHPNIEDINNLLSKIIGDRLEGCFLNGYKDSKDALGYHADDDPAIDHTRPIAVVTLYEGMVWRDGDVETWYDRTKSSSMSATPRQIKFREVLEQGSETVKPVFGNESSLELEQGSLLLMHPGMQFTHQHKIPKAGFNCRPRISLTYRGLIK